MLALSRTRGEPVWSETTAATFAAAWVGSSCSQTLMTFQPASTSARVTRSSLSALRCSLGTQ